MFAPQSYEEMLWLKQRPEDRPILEAIDAACDRIDQSSELQNQLMLINASVNQSGSSYDTRRYAGMSIYNAIPRGISQDQINRYLEKSKPPREEIFLFPTIRQIGMKIDVIKTRSRYGNDVDMWVSYGRTLLHDRKGIAVFCYDLPVVEALDAVS